MKINYPALLSTQKCHQAVSIVIIYSESWIMVEWLNETVTRICWMTALFIFCRYWAVAAPVYMCAALIFVFVFYVAYNFSITPPLDSINTITGICEQFSADFAVSLLTVVINERISTDIQDFDQSQKSMVRSIKKYCKSYCMQIDKSAEVGVCCLFAVIIIIDIIILSQSDTL